MRNRSSLKTLQRVYSPLLADPKHCSMRQKPSRRAPCTRLVKALLVPSVSLVVGWAPAFSVLLVLHGPCSVFCRSWHMNCGRHISDWTSPPIAPPAAPCAAAPATGLLGEDPSELCPAFPDDSDVPTPRSSMGVPCTGMEGGPGQKNFENVDAFARSHVTRKCNCACTRRRATQIGLSDMRAPPPLFGGRSRLTINT